MEMRPRKGKRQENVCFELIKIEVLKSIRTEY